MLAVLLVANASASSLAQQAVLKKPEKQPITAGTKQTIQKYATTYAHATCVSRWIYIRGPTTKTSIEDIYDNLKQQAKQQEEIGKSMYPNQHTKVFTGTDNKNLIWRYLSTKSLGGDFILSYLSKSEIQTFGCVTR